MSHTAAESPSEKLFCVICLEEKDAEFAQLPSCNHRFCLDCIQQWAKTQEQPVCPLCFVPFDSIRLTNGEEMSLDMGSNKKEPADAGFNDLDHSFFLGDVQRLLQRTHFLQDRSTDRGQHRQLQEIIDMLNSHKSHLEQRGDINPSSLLQELSSFDIMVTQITTTNVTSTPQSSGRRYGADDADCVSSDDDHDTNVDFFCCQSDKDYRQMRRARSHLHPLQRPSKSLENGKSGNRRSSKSTKQRRL